MRIGLPELVMIGVICSCLVAVIAAIAGGVVLLVRRSQKKG
jgi:hypothetical protein